MKKSLLKLISMSVRLILMISVIQIFTYSVLFGYDASAQMNAIIDKDLTSKSVKQIFKLIEKETDYNFIYDSGKIDAEKSISIAGQKNSVEDILTRMM